MDSSSSKVEVQTWLSQIDVEKPRRSTIDLTVLGVCTGTGLGHLDCALVRFGQESPSAPLRVRLQQFDSIPVPASVRDSVIDHLRLGRRTSKQATHLDDLLGGLCSTGIKAFCRKHGIESSSIDLVGTHSEASKLSIAQHNSDGAQGRPVHWNDIVAAETGISTAFDFVITDQTAFGPHSHPTTYVDRVFLRHPSKFRVCLNIDEVASLSFIPIQEDAGARATVSCSIGPGSLLIDYAMRYCTSNDQSEDHNGQLGSLGKIDQDIVDRFLDAHDYLRSPPSQDMAVEMFGDHDAQQLIDECLFKNMSEADILATITRVTAQNVLKQYHRLLRAFYPPDQQVDEFFICGRSARNSNIVDYLESELTESVITKPLSDIGIPGDAHEAVCYAYLALEAVLTQATQADDAPSNSARSNVDKVRARVVPGRGWEDLINDVLEFSGGQQREVLPDVKITGSLEAAVQDLEIR